MTARRARCWVERVVDSDTLVLWLEATDDVRVRYRVRIVGIEGGELGTEEGARGAAVMAEAVASLTLEQCYWLGSLNTCDQHGRLVGNVITDSGVTLTTVLKEAGHHWNRQRNGSQKRE